MDPPSILGDDFDCERGPDVRFKAADVRSKVLGENNSFRLNRKFATHFVFDLEIVLYVEKEAHGTSQVRTLIQGAPILVLILINKFGVELGCELTHHFRVRPEGS